MNGVDGPGISDGVHTATQPATRQFPYLMASNPDPPDLVTVFTAPLAPPAREEGAA
ncbi:hypothetical protein [Streptomyces sp. NPDC096311]|uniref:hypothetical protein n=1 Tax=Streptomyces sp. NPDC096311 TaxID=3366083 RepID=UPI003820745D